jgi:hypothetical protein
MRTGYNQPLYLLPFDHRHSYLTGICHFTVPLTADQRETVTNSKRVIYDGFKQALDRTVPVASAGILVDEEVGGGILRDGAEQRYMAGAA